VLGVDAVEFFAGGSFHDGRQIESGSLLLGQVEVGLEVVIHPLPEVAARPRGNAGNAAGADPVLHPVDDAALVAVVLGVEIHPVAAPAFENHERVIALENVPLAFAQVLVFFEVIAEVAQQLGQFHLFFNLLESEFVFHGKADYCEEWKAEKRSPEEVFRACRVRKRGLGPDWPSGGGPGFSPGVLRF
jgi:hypothetical protein